MNGNYNIKSIETPTSVQVQYFDGLGRPEQTVQVGITPSGNDLVSLQTYDGFGREDEAWLPGLSSGNGAYVAEAIAKTGAIHANLNDPKPFSKIIYEPSPLNRPAARYGPGADWHDTGRGKAVRTEYLTNVSGNDTLNCIHYAMTDSPTDTLGAIERVCDFGTGQLYVTRTEDEDGNTVFEFKDKLGRQILTRQVLRNVGGNDPHDTYYIYDDYDNLTAVLPPLASDAMKTGEPLTNVNSDMIGNYAYLYKYDHRNRCIAKRLPGAEWVYMIYDRADRLVMTQDGNLRSGSRNQWIHNIYDAHGRVIEVEMISFPDHSTNRNTLESQYRNVVSAIGFSAPKSTISETAYDGYPSGYDISANDLGQMPDNRTRGLKTFEKVAVLDGEEISDMFVERAFYYDSKGRVIQTVEKNHLGGISRYSTRYDFVGNVLASHEFQQTAEGTPPDVKLTEFTYDHADRSLREATTLNDCNQVVVSYGYDELGRLTSKTYGTGANAITETCDYNIRGWLTEKSSDVFDMRLRYYDPQQPDTAPSYTGNITEWEWKHKGSGSDNTPNSYAFTYDQLSRLTDSQLFQYSNDQWLRSGSFEEWLGAGDVDAYDKNGNILSLMRSSTTDSITDGFRYEYNGNQLTKLYLDWDNDSDFVTYAYDANGNCTVDGPNNLDLTYNYLNLIGNVSQDNATLANYVYLADGTKVSATNASGDGLVYAGSLVYSKQGDNLSLESTGFSGGRLVATSNDYEVRYFLADHLGSTRAVVNSAGVVLERNDFMPFGLAWTDANRPVSDNRYLYNGKEEQEFVGVPYSDFGARMYDPKYRLSWNGVDQLAEAYKNWSPYNYILNCPISYFDPSGLWPAKIHNRMITETFSGLLSSSDMNILMRASKMADAGEYQGVADSHRHAMGQKGLSKADSEAAYNNFINDQYNLYLNTQNREEALEHLGMALHAIMDWSSPTHHGFQVWKGFIQEKGFGLSHFLGEQMKAYLDPANQTKINASKEAMLNLLMKALEAKGEIIILPEITVIGSKPSKIDRQNLMDNMFWQPATPNSFGNTGRYNKSGRTTDQYYSDEFLKWYYGE